VARTQPKPCSNTLVRARSRLAFGELKKGRRNMKLGPGISFSWKRALGVTKAKRKFARETGIPLTRAGRRNKLGKWMGMK